MSTLLYTIVIATYRRPKMLRETLASFLKLVIPPDVLLEVIVIDNDPEGSAAATAREMTPECAQHFELRYVHEPRTGLSFARNRGIEESRGEIIGFLDDDIFITPQWLVAMLACFRESGADAVGGRTLIHWEEEPEPTVKACETELVAIDLGTDSIPLYGRRLPGGGNSSFKREAIFAGFRFSTDLGRIGDVLLSGEDTDFFERLRKEGKSLWYCADAVMHHRIGGARLTQAYLQRQKFWFGISYALIDRRLHGRLAQLRQGIARLGKVLLLDAPRYCLAVTNGDQAGKLLARCSIAKQLGYVRATLFPVVVHKG